MSLPGSPENPPLGGSLKPETPSVGPAAGRGEESPLSAGLITGAPATHPPDPQQNPQAELIGLIREHHQAVYGYALRLSGSPTDAEDLAQQAFLIACQKLHQVREAEKVRSWLLTVVRNAFLKSRKNPPPAPAAGLELDIDAIPEQAPETALDNETLQLALADLSDDYRLIVGMYYFEERSYKEIAEILGLPIGTVMSRLSRAKSRLRGQLLASDPELAEIYGESSAGDAAPSAVDRR
ncbi:RNA polymerase sigma factor [Lignipirellula cremea]|uniref:ECF RNA polymerase sigma factor SigR n=1 Tax=Lignipirellula cremea TaxID=2528010 RepID=A0A518E0M4_9BACT|nr:sigma-70 family RNA polymerase sigma factor [Lignipirellula cremea]QDU97627.1 ECF RNA polymerase sigma factor SigR [Lignipirellula cremea]